MGSWDILPCTLLENIYHHLSLRERFTCSMVCQSWKNALDCPSLWRSLPINLDSDLVDPTILVFLRKYHYYFKALELGWSYSHSRSRWTQKKIDVARRACKFLMVLSETNIQLNTIKFFDWYNGCKFKKMAYHISRFLKKQSNLVKISFIMVNFSRAELTKFLSSCLESRETIQSLEMNDCSYPANNTQEYVILISCFECLRNIMSLKIDYLFFLNGVLPSLLISKTDKLSHLEIYVRGFPSFYDPISDSDWQKLKTQNPTVQVSLYFIEVCHFEEISVVLKEVIPVKTISLLCGKTWDNFRSRQYRKTLQLITRCYKKTLENLYLHIKFNKEILDDVLVNLVEKCTKLQHIEFSGIVQSLEVIKDLYDNCVDQKFTSIQMTPDKLDAKTHLSIQKMCKYFSEIKKNLPLHLKISEIHYDQCIVHLYN